MKSKLFVYGYLFIFNVPVLEVQTAFDWSRGYLNNHGLNLYLN